MASFWESCLLRFEQELPEQQFNTWIKPLRLEGESAALEDGLRPVSYTHLDVYKRQPLFIANKTPEENTGSMKA